MHLTAIIDENIVTRVNNVTQADLATILKLDRSSVSLALSGSLKVSEKTRCRVQEAAQRMNYRPNLAARQLKSTQPVILALMIPETFETLSEPIVVMTLQALAQQAADKGIMLNILTETMVLRTIDNPSFILPNGIFVWGDVEAKIITNNIFKGLPFQVLDPTHQSYEAYDFPSVNIDNFGGAQAVTQHLIARGAERLLFVIGAPEHLGHQKRLEGARKAWNLQPMKAEMTVCVFDDLTSTQLDEFISKPGGAVFCSNDTTAILIWQQLIQKGISIPEQVLLAGFDNTPAAQLIGLTSAVFDCDTFARAAMETLLQLIDTSGRVIQPEPIPVILHTGETT